MLSEKKISDFMLHVNRVPTVGLDATLKNALDKMTKSSHGTCIFLDDSKHVVGILTDGDLRRLLLTKQETLPALLVSPAISFGTRNPITMRSDNSLEEAIALMDSKSIWDIPIVDEKNQLVGILNRHLGLLDN
jgi:CBS domain-containing protein